MTKFDVMNYFTIIPSSINLRKFTADMLESHHIISFQYHVSYDSSKVDAFVVTTPKRVVTFKSKGKLYVYNPRHDKTDDNGNEMALVQTVEGNKLPYTKREIADAEGKPSNGVFGPILEYLERWTTGTSSTISMFTSSPLKSLFDSILSKILSPARSCPWNLRFGGMSGT
eukprot:gene17280-19820_t